MLLAIDIGNTNIVVALFDGNEWVQTFRYNTKDDQPAIFYQRGLRDILLEWGLSFSEITEVAVSSVVPELNERILQAVQHNTSVIPFFLNPSVFESLEMHIPHPYVIGSDLVANAYAAINKYKKDCIVVDFGTALTFTVVSKSNGIEGVTIAPGLRTAISALSGNTAQLPEVSLELPSSVIGRNTDHAIKAGVLWGYVGLVKELLSKIQEERNESLYVIATGGLSSTLTPLASLFDVKDKYLTLEGIRLIAEFITSRQTTEGG